MKKLMTLAALVAACAPAFTAEVESSNTVGYQKIQLTQGYNMLSPMFNAVGGDVKAIKNIFEETDWVAADSASDADYISLWVNGGYSAMYFVSTDVDDNGAWASDQDSFSETDDQLPANVGFWLYNRGASRTVTLAGEVPPDSDVTVTIIPGYTMLANPFAVPLPIKSIVAASGEFAGSDSASDADYISIWRNGGYDAMYFVSTDADDAGVWASDQDSFSETDDTIAPGEAFWFYRRGSTMTITIPCPN